MKKTLIASAVAAAALSSNAHAMDSASDLAAMIESMPSVYGNIQYAYAYNEVDNGTTKTSTNEFEDNGSTLGIKHDHEIAEGVTGFFKAEYEFKADDKGATGEDPADNNLFDLDEAYIGVKGDFGSAQFGSDDTVYEWVDIMDMYEYTGLEGDLADQDEGDNFQYYSPEMSGLTVGVTLPVDSDTTFGGALAATYAMDNLELVVAYGLGREEQGAESGDAYGLAVTFGLEDLTLMAAYESKSENKVGGIDQDDGSDYMAIMAQYAMGASNFALGYSQDSFDAAGSEDQSDIYFQALHNVSDHMYVYLEYLVQTDVDGTKDNDSETLALGTTYYF